MREVQAIKYYEQLEPRDLTDEYVAGALRRAALRFLDEVTSKVET